MEDNGQAPPRRRGGWKTKLFIVVGGLILLGMGSLIWTESVNRHQASTYGIADPSSAALRIENRTSDFAITRVTLQNTEGSVAVRDVGHEIRMGEEAVVEITPGAYLVMVFYGETTQTAAGRPRGSLNASFTVSLGQAVILCLQGGRSSPEGLVFLPPELVFK